MKFLDQAKIYVRSGDGGNGAGGSVTLDGTYSGAADATLTVRKSASGYEYSIDGGAYTAATIVGDEFTVQGVTVNVAAVTTPTTGDSWTQDLTAAAAARPATPRVC